MSILILLSQISFPLLSLPYLLVFCLVLSSTTFSYPIQSYLILLHPILIHPILSCLIVFFRAKRRFGSSFGAKWWTQNRTSRPPTNHGSGFHYKRRGEKRHFQFNIFIKRKWQRKYWYSKQTDFKKEIAWFGEKHFWFVQLTFRRRHRRERGRVDLKINKIFFPFVLGFFIYIWIRIT